MKVNNIHLLRRMMASKSQVRAVFFDLGGTLVKIDNNEVPHIMKRMLEDCGVNRSLEDVWGAWVKSEEGLNFRDMIRLLDEFWVQRNLRLLRILRVDSDTRKLAEFMATHWWDYSRVSLYPDAEETLSQLKERGLKIGLITNGLRSDTNGVLPQVGLEDFFDVAVMVDTLRKMKPDAEVFNYALEKLKLAPSEAIFVGDEIETDYKGAKRCGLNVFLIDRDGKIKDERVNRIASLKDLLALIST